MPIKPGKDESQSDWMGRCVPEMMGDGKREQDQAVAACLSIWREKDKGAAKLDARVKQVDPPDDDEAEEEFIDRCVEQITQDEDIDEDEAEDRCRLMWDERAMRLRPRPVTSWCTPMSTTPPERGGRRAGVTHVLADS